MQVRLLRVSMMIASAFACTVGAHAASENSAATRSCGARPLRIVAHRGWRDPKRAENSLTEMKATRAQGVCMLEIDLAVSRDGTVYLLHDDTLDRSTTGHGAIVAASDGSIDGIRLKADSGEVTTDPLPRLTDVLQWARSVPGTELMLDIKYAPPMVVAELVRRLGMTRQVIVLTFDRATAAAALSADPDWRVSVLIRSEDELHHYRAMAGGRSLAAYVPTDGDPELFRSAHATGWSVVTDAIMPTLRGSLDQRAEKYGDSVYKRYFADRPVDVLVTNHAERVLAALGTEAPQFQARLEGSL